MKTKCIFQIMFLTVALISCGKNDDSTVIELPELQNEPPLNFKLIDVVNEATDVDVLPTFNWESAKNPKGGNVTYNLYLDKETNPTTLYKSDISETLFQVEERLNVLSDYYWKVVAKDADGRTSQSPTNKFTTRSLSIPEEPIVMNAKFWGRAYHTSLSFDGKLWVLGGASYEGGGHDDVWKSSDGISWTELGDGILKREKYGHTSITYDGKMWILGGSARNDEIDLDVTHDFWSSTDGLTWNNLTSYTDFFPARLGHSTVVKDNKIYVIGGYDGDSHLYDVWQYDNNWTEVALYGPSFNGRSFHGSVVHDNKIWVIGGYSNTGAKNDVWYSENGSNWSPATTNASFSPRRGHSTVVFDDKLWVIGGITDNGLSNEIWYSDDGIKWSQVATSESFPEKTGLTATVHNEQLWLIGGIVPAAIENGIPQYANDVWVLE